MTPTRADVGIGPYAEVHVFAPNSKFCVGRGALTPPRNDFIKTIAPEEMAFDWDHVGLLCGRADRAVTRVLVALDPFEPVCEEAAALGCQLLVTHHPAIWELKAVNDASPAGRALLQLIENGISAINAHTNLDCAPGGVNDCLAAKLGLHNISVPEPLGTDAQGRCYGLLRTGELAPVAPEAFASHVKTALGCEGVRFVPGARPVRRVAVGGGSCGDALSRVAAMGCDAFVTADCKYNTFADAQALGLTLVDAGHFETENPVCAYLAAALRGQFPQIEVILSKNHRDCIKFA